jgi:hypothetical protein
MKLHDTATQNISFKTKSDIKLQNYKYSAHLVNLPCKFLPSPEVVAFTRVMFLIS